MTSSVLPHQWHEECMRKLCQEPTKHMARSGLQSEPGPAGDTPTAVPPHEPILPQLSLRGWSQPSNQEKKPREDHLTGQAELRR